MNKIVLIMLPALICGMVLTSCSTENLSYDFEIEGIYVGSYTTTNLNRDFSWSTAPTIELKGGKFTYKETPEGVYRDVYGNYSINQKKIMFEIENYDFPWLDILYVEGATTLLLEGEYNYSFDGKKLIFSKVVSSPPEKYNCEFELYKQ